MLEAEMDELLHGATGVAGKSLRDGADDGADGGVTGAADGGGGAGSEFCPHAAADKMSTAPALDLSRVMRRRAMLILPDVLVEERDCSLPREFG